MRKKMTDFERFMALDIRVRDAIIEWDRMCPECGASKVYANGHRTLKDGTEKQRYLCAKYLEKEIIVKRQSDKNE